MARGPHHGWTHRRIRAWWVTRTPAGSPCAICGRPLTGPTSTWDLAHDDNDPTGNTYLGLTHRSCNRHNAHLSPRANGVHPWSKLGRQIAAAKKQGTDREGTERETRRLTRIDQRETERQQRIAAREAQRQRVILPKR